MPRINTSVNTSHSVDVDVDVPSRPRSPSAPTGGSGRPGSSRPSGGTAAPSPVQSPALAPPPGGGPLPPLVGAGTTVTVPAGAPAPRPRAQTWSMGQPIGAGGAMISFARTPAGVTTTATSTTSTSADPSATTSTTTTDANSPDPSAATSMDPNVMDPSITDPSVTSPSITGPSITGPNVTDPNVTGPNVTDPSQQNPGVVDPNPPLDRANKPWPNPESPNKRHLRLALDGLETTPGASGSNHHDVQVLGPSAQVDDTAIDIEMPLNVADFALEATSGSQSEFLRRQQLKIAYERLIVARLRLQERTLANPALSAERKEALDRADQDLKAMGPLLNDPKSSVDTQHSKLTSAHKQLVLAHRLTESTAAPDSPDATLTYIEAKLAAAEAKQSPDDDHFQKLQAGDAVQKLYVAPEWMFRRRPGQPPLSNQDFADIKLKVEALSRRYPDWVIVPGTVFHGDMDGEGKYRVRNDALVAHNGDVRVVNKRNEADNLEPNMVWAPDSNPTSSRFEASGYKYAVEICRDHPNGVALTESTELVDFHVVTSNNVFIAQHSVVARDGGIVILVDGNSGKASLYRVKWKQDPKGTAYQAYRQRLIENRARAHELSAEIERLNAESVRLKGEGREAERQLVLQELDRKRDEYAQIAEFQKRSREFLELKPIGGGKGDVVPDSVYELGTDQYA